jgi:hypothetical protein
MSKVSRERALIALRSFPSIRAAARSIGCTGSTLLRMTVSDTELAEAYEACVGGTIAARQREEVAQERRAREPPPRITERQVERRKARFFAATGRDPRVAAAALHSRLNAEARETKRVAILQAIDAVEAMQMNKPIPLPPVVKEVWDRWCARCQAYRVDDKCEVCGYRTQELR